MHARHCEIYCKNGNYFPHIASFKTELEGQVLLSAKIALCSSLSFELNKSSATDLNAGPTTKMQITNLI